MVSVCPGLSVTGKLPPRMLKPTPVIAAEFTVTGDVPVDVSINGCVVAVFTVTLPKLRFNAFTVNCGFAAVPVPPRATSAVPPVAELLLIVIWPLAIPAVVGSNCTCSVRACDGFSVTGKLEATIVKPAPVITTEFTVTVEVPVDVSVNDCVVAVFTATLPKLRLATLTDNCGLAAAVLVPLRVTIAVLPVDELLLIITWPLADPVVVGPNCTCSVSACPGFNVTGKLPPPRLKPAPEITTEFTVTAAVPLDVSVNDCVVDEFTVTLPKLKLAALTDNCGLAAAVLVPLRVTIAALPVDELLLIATWPLADPVVVGLNCTCSVNACPGFNVTGRLPPPRLKPAPEIAAEFTVTGEVPVDVSVNDCVVEEFTVTLPKLKLAALTDNCGLADAVLVPLRVTTVALPVDESLLIVTWPLTDPVVVGLNCTCSIIVCPGFSVTGKLPPRMLKPAPVIGAELTTTCDVPADVSVNDCVVAVFTVTLPKLKLAALTVNCELIVSELDGAVPDPHPISVIVRQVATSA
jgi:hypothetical protein